MKQATQGFAVAARSRATQDPPKAGGLWKPIHFNIIKVQGLGPSREGALGAWRVWAEPSLICLEGLSLRDLV